MNKITTREAVLLFFGGIMIVGGGQILLPPFLTGIARAVTGGVSEDGAVFITFLSIGLCYGAFGMWMYKRLAQTLGHVFWWLSIETCTLRDLLRTSVFVFVFLFALTQVARLFFVETTEEVVSYNQTLMPRAGHLSFVTMVFVIVVLGPVVEEVFFRGVLFRYLYQHQGFIFSASVSSAIFSLVHFYFLVDGPMGWFLTINIFVLGVFLCWIYRRDRNLTTAIWAHGLNNLVVTISTFSI